MERECYLAANYPKANWHGTSPFSQQLTWIHIDMKQKADGKIWLQYLIEKYVISKVQKLSIHKAFWEKNRSLADY